MPASALDEEAIRAAEDRAVLDRDSAALEHLDPAAALSVIGGDGSDSVTIQVHRHVVGGNHHRPRAIIFAISLRDRAARQTSLG